jgi:hypothetical protein
LSASSAAIFPAGLSAACHDETSSAAAIWRHRFGAVARHDLNVIALRL